MGGHDAKTISRSWPWLDVTALLATIKAVDGRPGHPSADPPILLALWLYATVEGIGSARGLRGGVMSISLLNGCAAGWDERQAARRSWEETGRNCASVSRDFT
jgi:hypothetical protein